MFEETDKLSRLAMTLGVLPILMVGMFIYLVSWTGTYSEVETQIHQYEMIIVNQDTGFEKGLTKRNLGKEFINRLKDKDRKKETVSSLQGIHFDQPISIDIDKNFIISEESNLEDVLSSMESGRYYLAIYIPPTFSNDFFSLFQGEKKKPTIQTYINQGRNSIGASLASMISLTMHSAIQQKFQEELAKSFTDMQTDFGDGETADISPAQINNLIDPLEIDIHYVNPVTNQGIRGMLPLIYQLSLWFFTFFFAMTMGMAYRAFRDPAKIWVYLRRNIVGGLLYALAISSMLTITLKWITGVQIQQPLQLFAFTFFAAFVTFIFIIGLIYLLRIYFMPTVFILFFIWAPSSGSSFPFEYMTPFMEWVHSWQMLTYLTEGARTFFYLESSEHIGTSLMIMSIYLLIGLAMILGVSFVRSKQNLKKN